VAGRTPAEAVANYLAPLQRAVSCVTDLILNIGGGYRAGKQHSVLLGDGTPVRLAGKRGLSIIIAQRYEIVEATGRRGPWKVHTQGYTYHVRNSRGDLLAYHWHPTYRVKGPHLHMFQSEISKCHLPTNRVSLEEVLRTVIVDLGAQPIREDWDSVLKAGQEIFEKFQTWPRFTPL
jgi:hypothetical protein